VCVCVCVSVCVEVSFKSTQPKFKCVCFKNLELNELECNIWDYDLKL
jgi:hypothetical protein